jgi:hypothetical protein
VRTRPPGQSVQESETPALGSRDDVVHAGRDVDGSAWSRRALLLGAGAGAVGFALSDIPDALARQPSRGGDSAQEVVNVASTIEVLTTVITTTALQKLSLPAAAVETVGAASREELEHFTVLTRQFGGHPATRRVWIPDALFATPAALFTGLVVGEQICINLYLVATTVWAAAGLPRLARTAAELVGNEAVHRALARQALNLQPNDRAFMKYNQPEPAAGPGHGMPGFTTARAAIGQFTAAGFGFGAKGQAPGAFYDFDTTTKQTPNPSFVNTRTPH